MADKRQLNHEHRFKKSNKRWKDDSKYKKFVGNRAEGQGFADKRKKRVQHEYLQMLRKEKRKDPSTTNNAVMFRRDEDEILEVEMDERKSFIFNRRPHSQTETQQSGELDGQARNESEEINNTNSERLAPEQSTSTYHQRNFRKQNPREFKKKENVFTKAIHEAQIRKEEAQKKREQQQKERQEKETALQNYKKKKRDNFYKFHCKRTSKGQPVMKYQMELLLQKIEARREMENK